MSKLPDLHAHATRIKNMRRLKHDGGRAWIKDSQLHDARKGANPYLEVIPEADATQAPALEASATAKALPASSQTDQTE